MLLAIGFGEPKNLQITSDVVFQKIPQMIARAIRILRVLRFSCARSIWSKGKFSRPTWPNQTQMTLTSPNDAHINGECAGLFHPLSRYLSRLLPKRLNTPLIAFALEMYPGWITRLEVSNRSFGDFQHASADIIEE